MNEYRRPAWADIDLEAIRSNIAAIKTLLTPSTAFMAVVKADAYGHGSIPVAMAALAGGADWLAVALIEEAIALREAGIDSPILILSEVPVEAAPLVIEYNVTATVYSEDLIAALSAAAGRQGVAGTVHLKLDTGMHRVGIEPGRAPELLSLIDRDPNLSVGAVFTHFACADVPDDNYTAEQLKRLTAVKAELPLIKTWHAANSAAAIFFPESRLDMVRIGIAMYGLQPSAISAPIKLRPALSLKARVAVVRELAPGEGVSYGLTYKAAKRTRAAVVPIGYGDGYPRRLSNRGQILIRGRRLNIIGNVCMDQFLTEIPDDMEVVAGDEATLIGGGISAEEVASWLDTINYEVVCMINRRVPRYYTDRSTAESLNDN